MEQRERRSRPEGMGGGARGRVAVALACLALVFVLAACAANKGVVRPDYSEVLGRWTRSTKIYSGFEARLYLSATFKMPAFREAYVEKYVKSYQLDPTYRQAMLERETEQGEKYNEFFIAAFTPVEKWNDFDQKDSVWKLYLEDDSGAKLSPVSIVKLDRTDPVLREFFPYFDLWSDAYVVKFPKYSAAGKEPIPSKKTAYVRLVATGVLGNGHLEWKLK